MKAEELMDFGLRILRGAKDPTRDEEFITLGRTIVAARMIQRGFIPDINLSFRKEVDLSSIGTAMWARNGFPTIEMGHKFAAALLVSTITQDLLDVVQPPWSSFMISVPDNLLFITDTASNQPTPVRRIMVFQALGKIGDWAYIAYGATGIALWRHGVTAALLLPPADEGTLASVIPQSTGSYEVTDTDRRTQILIGRLIIATSAATTIRGMSQPFGKGHADHANAKRSGGFPPAVPSMFALGTPIDIDLRYRVREFSTGKRDAKDIEVRILVCGHFKRQRYGVKFSQVKTIWLKPYWRGPVEAPVLIRPHVLQDLD